MPMERGSEAGVMDGAHALGESEGGGTRGMPVERGSKAGAMDGAHMLGESEGGGARGMPVERGSKAGAMDSARVSGECEGVAARLMWRMAGTISSTRNDPAFDSSKTFALQRRGS